MPKAKKSKYYAYQLGGLTDNRNSQNWNMPQLGSPSAIQQTPNGATDIYGGKYFTPDNNGTPTQNNPDIVPLGRKKKDWLGFLDPNRTELNPYVQNFNAVAQGVTGIADMIGGIRNNKYENKQWLQAITPKYYENMEGYGLNNLPAYTKYGGKATKYQVGGSSISPQERYYQSSAKLSYYKDILNNKLKEKNPNAYQDFFKGLVDVRRKGDTAGANNYVQNTPYNEYLSPNEVQGTLGDKYDDYLSSVKDVNSYDVSQGRQPLYGSVEGQDDLKNLNYGRRFASLQITPSLSVSNRDNGKKYERMYNYNPTTDTVGYTESGDPSLRPNYIGTSMKKLGGETPCMECGGETYMAKGGFKFKPVGSNGYYKNGGSIPTAYGLGGSEEHLANVEAEKGEVVQDFDGDIQHISNNAATHEQGGVKLPDVHRVLENTSSLRNDKDSKYLRLSPQDIKATTGLDARKPMSHAEAMVKANDMYEEQRNKIVKKIQQASKDRSELDEYTENATNLNIDHFKSIPSQQQIFDSLFNHQEAIKAQYGIGGEEEQQQAKKGGWIQHAINPKHKGYCTPMTKSTCTGHRRALAETFKKHHGFHKGQYGLEIMKYGGQSKYQLGGYSGNKSGLKTPAGHSDAFPTKPDYNFQNYLSDLSGKGFKYEGITNPKEFQLALYDYQLQHNPDALKSMWGEGMHQAGMSQAQKLGLVDDKGMFKQGALDDPDNLKKLRDVYADGILGVRTMNLTKKPPRIWTDENIPTEELPQPSQQLDTTIHGTTLKHQPESKFNEPLRWYDTASPVNAYMAALERIPGKYNPAEFNQLRYKLQDPTAALQQNQADYNAGLQSIQASNPSNSGAQMANAANLAASKYAANNQVLGSYENQNAQIKNNEITYNTQVRDKNSLADQQSRETFENKVLTSKAIQQEQKLTALDSLYKTIAENRALNRNGNLVMKFSRAFNQYGDYNGYQPVFGVNPALGIPNSSAYTINPQGTKTQAAGGVQGLQAGKNYYNRKTGKTLYFNGTSLVER